MNHCLACGARYPATQTFCPTCGFKLQNVDGFIAFAPELALGGGGFEAAYFPELARPEESSFWFRARNDLIIWGLERYCKGYRSYLEIGIGWSCPAVSGGGIDC